mmetsp:Transcript_18433/g.63975  ORF Transcript_18433/g.63975 Transcript_18433/m.63975 type:complete len:202 (-) Transcript_18433:2352-2957(-)
MHLQRNPSLWPQRGKHTFQLPEDGTELVGSVDCIHFRGHLRRPHLRVEAVGNLVRIISSKCQRRLVDVARLRNAVRSVQFQIFAHLSQSLEEIWILDRRLSILVELLSNFAVSVSPARAARPVVHEKARLRTSRHEPTEGFQGRQEFRCWQRMQPRHFGQVETPPPRRGLGPSSSAFKDARELVVREFSVVLGHNVHERVI